MERFKTLLAQILVTPLNKSFKHTIFIRQKKKPRVTDLIEGRTKPKEKDYVDFFEDIEKSIFGAAQNIGYSFGDLVTTGIDASN